jgi:hypothetical protein
MPLATVRRYLSIPLQLAPLLFIAIFSVAFALAGQAGLFGIPLMVILFVGFCNYSFAVMDAMANGAKESPTLSVEMMNPVGGLKSLAVLAIVSAAFFGTDAASYWMDWLGELLVGLLTLAVLLAVVTAQGASGSLAQAFNPWRIYRLIARLGSDFGILFGSALAIFLMGYAIASLAFIPSLLTLAALMAGWLAVFALIGGVLHERREDLGLDEVDTPDRVNRPCKTGLEKERDAQVDRIYGEWRSGAHRNAWQTVIQQLQSSADPLEELRWLYERIARWPDPHFANRLTEERITRLLAAGRKGEGLSAMGARLLVDPDFRPRSSTDLLLWARLALDGGERRIARQLLKDFPRVYPKDSKSEVARQLEQQLEG